MLRRTFLGTLAAIPIIGLPLRAIGRAVPYETSRLTIQWQDQDAPEVTLAMYSDESVRCWLGTKELTQPVRILPIQKCQQWSFVGSDGEWSVDLLCRRQDADTIDLERIMMWKGVGFDPHFGLDQHPLSKDYGIGYWIDLNNP